MEAEICGSFLPQRSSAQKGEGSTVREGHSSNSHEYNGMTSRISFSEIAQLYWGDPSINEPLTWGRNTVGLRRKVLYFGS